MQRAATCFIWDETQAKRGSDEICSCIIKWIEAHKHEGFKKLVIYADNCAGQNKNIYLILNCLRLLHKDILQEITIEFMVPGHSYLPCDRTFGQIEQKIKKSRDINCPDDYVRVIQDAIEHGNDIIRMEQKDFIDIKSLLLKIILRTPKFLLCFRRVESSL